MNSRILAQFLSMSSRWLLSLLLLLHNIYVNLSHHSDSSTVSGHRVSHSEEISDKQIPPGAPASEPQSLHTSSPPASPRPRTHSWGPSSMWQQSLENGLSTDTSESLNSTSPQRTFEVTNRPVRQRQRSESWRAVPLLQTSAQYNVASRSLGDIDWLQRRRSLNAVVSNALFVLGVHSPYPTIHPFLPSLHFFLHNSKLNLRFAISDVTFSTLGRTGLRD